MLGDPTWLGKYLEYVARFQLQKAPVFNLDGKHGPWDTCPRAQATALGPRLPGLEPPWQEQAQDQSR